MEAEFIIFLLGSSAVNLVILLSYKPSQIATTFAGEWIFEDTLCDVNGFFTGSDKATVHVLALISVDRFLFLVKPLVHKQYFNSKFSCLLCGHSSPLIDSSEVTISEGST